MKKHYKKNFNYIIVIGLILAVADYYNISQFKIIKEFNLSFWKNLVVPILIFKLTTEEYTRYTKENESKKNRNAERVIIYHQIALIDLAESIYDGFMFDPIPPRLIEEMEKTPPFYVIELKNIENKIINALEKTTEYEDYTYPLLIKCRTLICASHLNDIEIFQLRNQKLYTDIKEEKEKLVKKLEKKDH